MTGWFAVQNRMNRWAAVSPRAAIAATAVSVFALLAAPTVALGDPLPSILDESANLALPQVLDDEALAQVRGRGLEGESLSIAGSSVIAVVLWDEPNQTQQRSQQGTRISRSTGLGNAQANSLVTKQY